MSLSAPCCPALSPSLSKGRTSPLQQSGLRRGAAYAAMLLLFSLITVFALPAHADEAGLRESIAKFAAARNFKATEAVVQELAATGDPAVERPLAALAEGDLYFRKADSSVFIGKERGPDVRLSDPLTGEVAGEAKKPEMTKIKVNNALRRTIRDALGGLTLGPAHG